MCVSAVVSRHCITVSSISPESGNPCSSDLLAYLPLKLKMSMVEEAHDLEYFNLSVWLGQVYSLVMLPLSLLLILGLWL